MQRQSPSDMQFYVASVRRFFFRINMLLVPLMSNSFLPYRGIDVKLWAPFLPASPPALDSDSTSGGGVDMAKASCEPKRLVPDGRDALPPAAATTYSCAYGVAGWLV